MPPPVGVPRIVPRLWPALLLEPARLSCTRAGILELGFVGPFVVAAVLSFGSVGSRAIIRSIVFSLLPRREPRAAAAALMAADVTAGLCCCGPCLAVMPWSSPTQYRRGFTNETHCSDPCSSDPEQEPLQGIQRTQPPRQCSIVVNVRAAGGANHACTPGCSWAIALWRRQSTVVAHQNGTQCLENFFEFLQPVQPVCPTHPAWMTPNPRGMLCADTRCL